MKDLFMCLLLNLAQHGKITEANMFKGGAFSYVTVKTDDGIYKVSIYKDEAEQENNGND